MLESARAGSQPEFTQKASKVNPSKVQSANKTYAITRELELPRLLNPEDFKLGFFLSFHCRGQWEVTLQSLKMLLWKILGDCKLKDNKFAILLQTGRYAENFLLTARLLEKFSSDSKAII